MDYKIVILLLTLLFLLVLLYREVATLKGDVFKQLKTMTDDIKGESNTTVSNLQRSMIKCVSQIKGISSDNIQQLSNLTRLNNQHVTKIANHFTETDASELHSDINYLSEARNSTRAKDAVYNVQQLLSNVESPYKNDPNKLANVTVVQPQQDTNVHNKDVFEQKKSSASGVKENHYYMSEASDRTDDSEDYELGSEVSETSVEVDKSVSELNMDQIQSHLLHQLTQTQTQTQPLSQQIVCDEDVCYINNEDPLQQMFFNGLQGMVDIPMYVSSALVSNVDIPMYHGVSKGGVSKAKDTVLSDKIVMIDNTESDDDQPNSGDDDYDDDGDGDDGDDYDDDELDNNNEVDTYEHKSGIKDNKAVCEEINSNEDVVVVVKDSSKGKSNSSGKGNGGGIGSKVGNASGNSISSSNSGCEGPNVFSMVDNIEDGQEIEIDIINMMTGSPGSIPQNILDSISQSIRDHVSKSNNIGMYKDDDSCVDEQVIDFINNKIKIEVDDPSNLNSNSTSAETSESEDNTPQVKSDKTYSKQKFQPEVSDGTDESINNQESEEPEEPVKDKVNPDKKKKKKSAKGIPKTIAELKDIKSYNNAELKTISKSMSLQSSQLIKGKRRYLNKVELYKNIKNYLKNQE